MKETEKRNKVVQAGKKLTEMGLIARTWGNISCRLDEEHFLITPSGRGYETLTPEEIVKVSLRDLSYQGDILPSSEKRIHREVYLQRPDINFVIHTHQNHASAVSSSAADIPVPEEASRKLIGEKIPIAAYGLPGTKKLWRGVTAALSGTASKGLIMAYHGALCFGVDDAEAFSVAEHMERVCEEHLYECCRRKTGKQATGFSSLLAYYLGEIHGKKEHFHRPEENGESLLQVPEELVLRLSGKRKDLRHMLFSKEEEIRGYSLAGRTLLPFLDDLAQIAGPTVRCISLLDGWDEKRILRGLRGRNAVFIKGQGALCCGESEKDAQAVELVLKKGCRAAVAAVFMEGAHPIPFWEARIMRHVYKKKYSLRVERK